MNNIYIHLAMLIGQQPIVGSIVKSESNKPWQK